MKATATQYAKALYKATKDKNQREIDGILADFVKVLSKNNQIRLAGNVGKKFGEVYNKENGIVEAEVTSCEKLGESIKKKIKDYIKDKYSAKEVIVNNIIEKSIKGGVIVKVGDEVMDSSIEKALKNLKCKLIS
jgi:F-type H+-transporting ATPase subunit delta